MKPCKSANYFIPQFQLGKFIVIVIIVTKYIFIVTNLTDFHKMVETGVDLHLIRIEELNVTGPHFVIQMCKNTIL